MNKMTSWEALGRVFALYFMIYPPFYYGYNFVVDTFGFAQYVIPGFWVGMVCLLVYRFGVYLFIRPVVKLFFKDIKIIN